METYREQRQWWAMSEHGVSHVWGYSCAPTYPREWWCPTLCMNLTEEVDLFKTELEALEACMDSTLEEIKRLAEIRTQTARRVVQLKYDRMEHTVTVG